MAILEKQKHIEKNQSIKILNGELQKTWKDVFSIDDILDFNLGAIKFKDFEWELIKNSAFKTLFSEKYLDSSYKYIMESDDGVILRGCECYYYIAAFKNKSKQLNNEFIINWLKNIRNFLTKSIICLDVKIILSSINKKFILGILDHLRMVSTIMATFNMNLDFSSETQLKIYDSISELYKLKFVKILDSTINQYLNILFKGRFNKSQLIRILKQTIAFIDEDIEKISNIQTLDVLINSFKIHREIDCLIENYISVYNAYVTMSSKNLFDNNKKYLLIAIMNGALEMPLILKTFMHGKRLSFGFFSDYRPYIIRHNNLNNSTKHTITLQSTDLIIMDDNIMTGKSIDNLLNLFKSPINYQTILVRHPNINRINQTRYNGVCININELRQKAYGMTFDSPYTKLKVNTNYGNEFLDELGIFTLTGDLFLKLLYKNGHFAPNSEVSTIRGLLNDKK